MFLDLQLLFFASNWGGVFTTMQNYLYFYIPLLTMSLVSKELSSGSIRLLYSSPITNTQIIVGKILLYDDLRSYHDRNLVLDHSL